jgi:hypothetical protein
LLFAGAARDLVRRGNQPSPVARSVRAKLVSLSFLSFVHNSRILHHARNKLAPAVSWHFDTGQWRSAPGSGTLEHAQSMAADESARTTNLYDRTKERLTQDEIERIMM